MKKALLSGVIALFCAQLVVADLARGREFIQMGLNAYRENNFKLAQRNFTHALDYGVIEGSVALAYLALHDLPGSPINLHDARKYMKHAVDAPGFKAVIYTSIFYQETRTPQAAYMVGMAYYLHPDRDQFKIGDEPAWGFWYERARSSGYQGIAYKHFLDSVGGISWNSR